ncbi:MAG: hypothetical protein OEQ53_11055 [Saprospiraceae bacterium]|nr:hypothetical protein [Saprospiraceae bacterium]
MKRLLIVVLLFFYTGLHAHVELVFPQGGESFITNSTIEIEWFPTVPHNTENWDLLISADGGITWDMLQANIHVDTLTFSWLVPSNASSETRIRVIQDNVGTDYDDQSDNFSIVANMVWNGAMNSAWDNESNWESATVPNSSHPLVIPNTAINYPVIAATIEAYGKELTIMLGAEFEVLSGGLIEISGQ